MSASPVVKEVHPENLVWAALSFAVVLGGSLLIAGSFRPSDSEDLEARRGKHRLEVRTKGQSEAEAKLSSPEWVKKEAGLVRAPVSAAVPLVLKDLKDKKPVASSVKVDPPLPSAGGDQPNLPSSPGGAATIRFPKLEQPKPAEAPAPAPAPTPVPAAPAAPASVAPPAPTPAPAN